MDIYSYLKDDNRDVNDLMEQILFLRVPEKKREWFLKIAHELLLHAETEQATFYAALGQEILTEDHIGEALKEQDKIRKYIDKLLRIPIESKKWLDQFSELRHLVLHHVYKEEHILFPKARKVLSEMQAAQLAEAMESLKLKKLGIAA